MEDGYSDDLTSAADRKHTGKNNYKKEKPASATTSDPFHYPSASAPRSPPAPCLGVTE
jgi:hypothetical protein